VFEIKIYTSQFGKKIGRLVKRGKEGNYFAFLSVRGLKLFCIPLGQRFEIAFPAGDKLNKLNNNNNNNNKL
jgi:hypothetical protein